MNTAGHGFDRSVLLKLIENFETQYIIPVDAFASSERKELLNRAGITQQMKGNQMAVVVDAAIVAAMRGAPADVLEKFHSAGWGLQGAHTLRNPASHAQYTQFVTRALDDIVSKGKLPDGSPEKLTADGQVRATLHLFDFAMQVTKGLITSEMQAD